MVIGTVASVAPISHVPPAQPAEAMVGLPATAVPKNAVGYPLGPDPDPARYYAPAQGKQGADLLHALHLIIRTGHTDSGYNQARDGMFSVMFDDANNNHVVDVYTGRVESNVSDRKTAFTHGLNTEHTWPQSLGARGIAQSDLHQLLPADIKVNQIRGNMPYGMVKDVEWSTEPGSTNESVLGTDASGTRVFQPRPSVRGDIARGLMYFYTRYNESRPADYSLDNFRHELPVLMQWAKEDPVDDAERRHNDIAFQLQHNRNPFVDHPEWIEPAFTGLKV